MLFSYYFVNYPIEDPLQWKKTQNQWGVQWKNHEIAVLLT